MDYERVLAEVGVVEQCTGRRPTNVQSDGGDMDDSRIMQG